jgi:hypothetical protein
MSKYGDTAVRAAGLLREGCGSARDAWQTIADQVFADSEDGKRKTCPREAFLGLCQAGLIRGVSAATCVEAESGLNRGYARKAVRLLAADPKLAKGTSPALWRRVMKELGVSRKEHNRQMDVVLALWNEHLINA